MSFLRRFITRLRGGIDIEEYQMRGLKMGRNCNIPNTVFIDPSHYWHITIGNNVTLSPYVYLLAHDASMYRKLGYTKIGKIIIEDNAFIGARSIIMPGVRIGKNSVIGAGSVVTRDVPKDSVAFGSPAKVVCSLDEFIKRKKSELKKYPKFGEEYTLRKNVTMQMKEEMNNKMKDGFGYVV